MKQSRCVLVLVCLLPGIPVKKVCAAPAPGAREVAVCLNVSVGLRAEVLVWTQMTATEIFEHIGVPLRFTCAPTDMPAVAAEIRFSTAADPGGALGFARPFAREGVRATLLYDRFEPLVQGTPTGAGSILGHLLAHELGHVLSGVDSHAPAGLMRAHWTADDFAEMRMHPLDFAPDDAFFIRGSVDRAMARRRATPWRISAAPR